MLSFPKKYTTKDIQHLQMQYHLTHPTASSALSLFSLPASQSLHLGHLYGLYLQDFIRQTSTSSHQLPRTGAVFEPKGMLSMHQAQQFFEKKHQTFLQIGTIKLTTYLKAQQGKKTKANQKMLATYAGMPLEMFTYDAAFSHFIWEKFSQLRTAGKFTTRKNISYRSIDLQSSIADQDILRKKEIEKIYTIKYFIETKSDILPTWSEIPDLIFGDVALLVHPNDKRYKKLIGKKAIIPIVNRMIPIIGDKNVDISKGNGIKRVNPCADFESIALAEKYHLPLDHYIFDTTGNYTEYAGPYQGKPRKEFYDNVVQFLEDISNLWQIYTKETLIPYYRHSQERLYPFLVEEIVGDISKEKTILRKHIEEKKILVPQPTELWKLLDQCSGVINRQIPRGVPIPLIKTKKGNIPFDLSLLEKGSYNEELQRYFDFSLLWFALHQYLKLTFDSTQMLRIFLQQKWPLIDALTLIGTSHKKADQGIKKLLTLLETLVDEEKVLLHFEKLVQNSQVLHTQGELFFLSLPKEKTAIQFFWATFDSDFLACWYPIFLAEQGEKLSPTAFYEQERLRRLAYELLRQQALCGKPFFTELLPFESFLDTKKQERFSYQTLQTNQLFTLLDTYGISPMRLSLLIQKNFSLETICLYDGLLKQIWNGVRYVWSQTEDTWTLEKATAEFDKNADALDSWIIGEFLPVRRRYTTLTTPEEVISFFPYLQQFIQKKLLARYLEVKKVQPEGTMQATMTILFSAIFQILHPFLPEYVEALLAVSGYQWEPLIRFPALKKTALDIEIMFDLFEMIYTFKLRLHIKKHQKIALFLKADPNFLALFNPRKPVIQILFNVEQISSIRLHETNPIGYEVGELQSMIVGIKVQSPAASPKKPTLDDLQQDYQKQLEYFEILRNEIINLSPLGASPLLENKKEEREIIKLRIEKLELAIQKLKMK